MHNKKTVPQERGTDCTIFDLWERQGHTDETLSERLGIDMELIRRWRKGREGFDSQHCIKLSELLGCSLKTVYLAILNTPKPK